MMRKSEALVNALIVCLGMTLPVTAWAEQCCGGHSGSEASHHGTGATHERESEVNHEHSAAATHERTAADAMFENYFDIRASLAQDSLEDVPTHANAFAKAIENSGADDSAGENTSEGEAQRSLEAEMATTARVLARDTDIESARVAFGKLSSQLYEYRKMGGRTPESLHVFSCDMAKKIWLQETPDPGNPYYGRSMAKCAREIK